MYIDNMKKGYLSKEFDYPETYKKILRLGLTNVEPWYIWEEEKLFKIRYEGLQKRYPERQLIPFAQRIDNDDIACFELEKGTTVQIIHDFATSGWEQRKIYNDFSEWFKEVIAEMLIEIY